MRGTQTEVLEGLREALINGQQATLVSVAQTWGTSPRQVGALLAITSNGRLYGSVSGGCVEEDLIHQLVTNPVHKPRIQFYGDTAEERHRFGLPCGGTIKLVLEPITDVREIDQLITHIKQRDVVERRVDLNSGKSQLITDAYANEPTLTERYWSNIFGPTYQLIIIGAGQTSHYLAEMALALEYKVHICDPRPEYYRHWPIQGAKVHTDYPDDSIEKIGIDVRTAVVAVSHDLKLDDLALLASLDSNAFYVGALGSAKTTRDRKQRLKEHFGFKDKALSRLHGPIGFNIGSKTPPEIALSVLAEVTAIKNEKINIETSA